MEKELNLKEIKRSQNIKKKINAIKINVKC